MIREINCHYATWKTHTPTDELELFCVDRYILAVTVCSVLHCDTCSTLRFNLVLSVFFFFFWPPRQYSPVKQSETLQKFHHLKLHCRFLAQTFKYMLFCMNKQTHARTHTAVQKHHKHVRVALQRSKPVIFYLLSERTDETEEKMLKTKQGPKKEERGKRLALATLIIFIPSISELRAKCVCVGFYF